MSNLVRDCEALSGWWLGRVDANNRACVRYEHLDAVTHAENCRRAAERRTHCKNGHEWNETNTYLHKGKRNCRRRSANGSAPDSMPRVEGPRSWHPDYARASLIIRDHGRNVPRRLTGVVDSERDQDLARAPA